MTQLTIRPIQQDDLPQVLTMVHALAAHHDEDATLNLETLARDTLGEPPWTVVLVAEREGDLLGYAGLCPLLRMSFGNRGMDIHHLFVAQAARGQGVGKMLIRACEDHARAQACHSLCVGTHPDNLAAQEVYRSVGFDDVPSRGPRFAKAL